MSSLTSTSIKSPHWPHLPIELISSILDHIPNPSTIRNCSLVCRAWVPTTRSYGFRRLDIRDSSHLEKLVRLCSNELETLTGVNVREVTFLTPSAMNNNVGRFTRMFALRSSIQTLKLVGDGTRWENVPHTTAKVILKELGRVVSKLEIWRFSFESPTAYVAVLGSFPSLQELELVECHYNHLRIATQSQPQVVPRASMVHVRSLTLHSPQWGIVPYMSEPLITCEALRTLRIRPACVPSDSEAVWFQRILDEAGDNLEEIDLELNVRWRVVTRNMLQDHFLSRSLDVSNNTNLCKLRIACRFVGGTHDALTPRIEYLLLILRRVAETARPGTCGVQILDLPPYVLDHEMDWDAVDEILSQHPFFSNLKEIRCDGFVCCFSEKDCVDGDWSKPSEASEPGRRIRQVVERVKARLWRCEEKGILAMGVSYQLLSTLMSTTSSGKGQLVVEKDYTRS